MEDIRIHAFADEADANIDGQIEAMKRNGLAGLEIRNVDGTSIFDITVDKAKEVKKKLDDSGFYTWSIGSPVGKIKIDGDFEEHKEKFKNLLEVSSVLEAKNMRIFSFFIEKGADYSIYRNQVIENLSELIELAKPYKINMCHENEKGIYGDVAERCLDLLKNLPDLKGIFDPANFLQCGVDTLKAWEMLKPYIYYMHIKDVKSDGEVVPAGFGDGHVKEIAHQYIANGGRCFTMEPHLAIFDGLAALENEDDKSLVSNFVYKDNNEAFDAACTAFKNLL